MCLHQQGAKVTTGPTELTRAVLCEQYLKVEKTKKLESVCDVFEKETKQTH